MQLLFRVFKRRTVASPSPSEHAIGKVQEHLELLGLNGTRQLPVCADYVTLWLKA
jgi:hypothetical protein